MKNPLSILLPLLGIALALTACRDDIMVVPPLSAETGDTQTQATEYVGMYVLNEGNMGSNKATLDYLDFATGTYTRNIYPSRNPGAVMELGDVGNDIKIYGSQLWMVINCSNKVEVADARTAVSRGHVDIPNCRYVAFDNGYAYVSSYVGEVGGKSVLGSVYKIDTLTLSVVDRVTVGYQPDELAVLDGKLYVANSGGYNPLNGMDYDYTVSIIDLASFREERKLYVAPNLCRLRADSHGQLWVTSRGDYADFPPRLYVLAKDEHGEMQVADSIDRVVSDLTFRGDSLIYCGSEAKGKTMVRYYGIINTLTHQPTVDDFLHLPEGTTIRTPYGIMVHPQTGDVYVMDATNYVSSGKLFCFDEGGGYKWETWTGDIPGHAVLLTGSADNGNRHTEETSGKYIAGVDEYVPAPGQFVNVLPEANADDNVASMLAKCTERLANGRGGMVTLGGYGGYITFHFDHPVSNVKGEYDFYIAGNAYEGNSEPGIVMVAQDTNHNGLPDDSWYELAGSADADSVGSVLYGYEITYTRNPMGNTPWTDNQGRKGTVDRNAYHAQEYFPLWLNDELTFRGTLLPPNAHNTGSATEQHWVLDALRYGYVDNLPNSNRDGCSFNIEWAVDAERNPVELDHVDFIRVYNAQNQKCGWIGETSTEITGAEDLHYINR